MNLSEELDQYQNIVTLYKNEEGKVFIGSTLFYNRGGNNDYMNVMYKEALPEGMGVMDGWNYLDDNSAYIILVPEQTAKVSVEDQLYAHGFDKGLENVNYHIVGSYPDIDAFIRRSPLTTGAASAFCIRK
ncbi:MAG: hypothetical protein VZT48_04135 [Bulleidia sp.]|nr:hypothetical protein [Bulleidia sp.]